MSNNEALIAPTPITDTSDTQAVSMPMAEEQAYTYQRADGTVESARNAEDAIARCPILGKLAIEAPDQASILLELAAAGNAKVTAEATEEPKKPPHLERLSKPAKTVESEKKISENNPEQMTRAELPTIVSEQVEAKRLAGKVDNAAGHHADIKKLELQRQAALRTLESAVQPNTYGVVSEKLKVEALKEYSAPLGLSVTGKVESVISYEISRGESEDAAPPVNLEVEQPRQQDTEIQENSSQPTHIQMVLGSDDVEAPDLTLMMDNDSLTELVNYEVESGPDKNTELLFEPETIETYLEIGELVAQSGINTTTESENMLNELKTESESELSEHLTFEAFLTTRLVTEAVTVEYIKEQSSKQPLEQTLAQLVGYMTDTVKDERQLEPLLAIIKDIKKSLPNRQVPEEVTLQITPELTDQLIILLRKLGYQNPREALVSMVDRHGFTFLLQSLAYLFQLADEDNRRELLSISTPALSSNDTLLSTLSRLILKLVMGKEFLPDNVAV